jgi:predicted ATPase/transcriptional regulator with XRE-family HTH domain
VTDPSFAELLRQHRLSRGLTQAELAERAGLSWRGISDLERGVKQAPRANTVRLLVHGLGLPGPEAIALLCAAQPGRDPVAHSGPGRDRHNLPLPTTSFIGRDQELAGVAQRLIHARVLTLTGIGGCGKTRLALEVARTVIQDYPDGVWLVELAPVADPDLVPRFVATVVGVPDGVDQPVIRTLTSALRSRRLLLVLDNCEHVLDACARTVDELRRSCAHLRVLATSREALGLTGEVAWRVPSLAVPDSHHQLTLAELGANPSVRLFVERAVAGEPCFTLTERNAPAVAQICRRLDGIPLALELAAARTQVLTPEQIAARLDQRFRLLTGGSRAALPRQQTLRATLNWSYELLTEPERLLLDRLTVFAGGWSLEAAEGVCANGQIGHDDVLDLLAQLVSKSLVLVDETGEGAKRFRLLETVRQYGRERLLASGEAEATHRRHANYFLSVGAAVDVEQVNRGCATAPTAALLRLLEAEQDNLRVALRWWIDSQDAERVILQAGVLFQVWFWHGSVGEGQAWLKEILALPALRVSSAARQRALPLLANLACRHADYVVALQAFEELLAMERACGDRLGAAYTLVQLANVHYLRAAYTEAWACLDACRAGAGDLDDRALDSFRYHYGGMLALCEGRYELARTLAAKAMVGFDSGSNRLSSAYCQITLGTLDREDGSYQPARARFLTALEVGLDYGDRTLLAHLLEGLSGVASALGGHEHAIRLGGAAAALREAAGAPLSPAWQCLAEHWLTISRHALGEEAATSAWVAGQGLTLERALAEARQAEV